MHNLKLGAACAASAIAILGSQPAHAQFTELPQIVITPNRAPTEAERSGSRVETVTRMEMEEQNLPLAVDYLERLPGISVTSPGGPGAEGSLSVRGAPRRYVKTLYNGIDIGDPTSPQVQTSYQYLLSGGLDSIEVLKGSQSTLYGSDAIAGVISFSTLGDIEPGVSHILHGEAGSRGTVRGGYGLRAATDAGRAAVNITGFRTDGISAAAGGSERDGYENVTFDAAADYRFNEVVSVFGSLLFIDAEAEFDNDGFLSGGIFFPPSDNLTAKNLSRQLGGRAGVNVDVLDGRFRNQFSIQAFDIDRTIEGTTFDGVYEGERRKIEYQGAFDVTERVTLQGGADYEWQDARFPAGSFNLQVDADFTIGGVWLDAMVEPVDNLDLTVGVRQTEHSDFGGDTAYRASASYLIPGTSTRFLGSIGTGFRAPSLSELFGPFGPNPDLQPETSFGFDLGIEQRFLEDRLTARLTYFDLDIDDLIVSNASTGFVYENTPGTSTHRGIEASFTYDVNNALALGGAYTYTDTKGASGARLIRVPRHEVALTAAYKPAEKWTITSSAKFVADTVDSGDFELDDYVLVNAKVSYQATESTELYVRGENLLDQDYQTVRGYNTPGIGVFAGFRSTF